MIALNRITNQAFTSYKFLTHIQIPRGVNLRSGIQNCKTN